MIELQSITKKYGERTVVDDVSFSVQKNEFITVLGPSGSGKTTLLMAIAGFIDVDRGIISLDDKKMTDKGIIVPPYKRNIGMVFQDLALWPHMTVEQHMLFVLKNRGCPSGKRKGKVDKILSYLELDRLRMKIPSTLSGGESQRVALGRALVSNPSVLLLDEPLVQLDMRLKDKIVDLLMKSHKDYKTTSIYVTHDYSEAFRMADRVLVLSEGRLVQQGAPADVYTRPATKGVAEITGNVSFLEGECEGDTVDTILGSLPCMCPNRTGKVHVCLRPADISVRAASDTGYKVVRSSFVNGKWHVAVGVGGGIVVAEANSLFETGSEVEFNIKETVWTVTG